MYSMIYTFLLIALLSACTTKIKQFHQYEKVPLLELEHMPTKEDVDVSLPRILLIASKPTLKEIAETNAHQVVKNRIITILESQKFASIVERNKNKKILQEQTIAEFEGKSGESLKSVDYILEINIANITFSRTHKTVIDPLEMMLFATSVAMTNGNTNASIGSSTKYEYTSAIDGIIKIYAVPKMNIIATLPLNGLAKSNELASVDSNVSLGLIRMNVGDNIKSKAKDSNLTYKAINKAIANMIPQLKKFLKKEAYILEKRQLKNKVIFAINHGKDQEFKSQDRLTIIREVVNTNPLTDEDEALEEEVCNGIIAKNTIFKKRSWVLFDESCSSKIRLGDKVFVQY